MDASTMRGFTPLTTLITFNDKSIERANKNKVHESICVSFGNAGDMQAVQFLLTRDEARILVDALSTCIGRDYDGRDDQTVCVLTDWHIVTDRDGQDHLCCDLCAHLYPTGQYRKPASCPNCGAVTMTRAN